MIYHVAAPVFRTAWFLESMATQILVIFVIRTNGRPWADLPRRPLAASSLGALLVAMALPFTPVGAWFGFVAPGLAIVASLGALTVTYLVTAELLKTFLFDHPAGRGRRLAPHRRRTR
jgi:Mg2+-importing ATPase